MLVSLDSTYGAKAQQASKIRIATIMTKVFQTNFVACILSHVGCGHISVILSGITIGKGVIVVIMLRMMRSNLSGKNEGLLA